MKVGAKGLRVRDQLMEMSGVGFVWNFSTKRYDVSFKAYGDDGRQLTIQMNTEEFIKVKEAYDKMPRGPL